MAKFKRFDPKNRKASTRNNKYDDYTTTTSNKYDYIKRKAEREDVFGYYDADSDDESTIFQSQRTGVRL